MKNCILFIAFILLITSCSSIKNTQEDISNGNYDSAINTAVDNLKRNKTKKKNQPYILLLEEAFTKATAKDLARINFLKKENNPEKIETIFVLYENLKRRQEILKPLLPLFILAEKRNAVFQFTNYDDEIIANKNQLSVYLYSKAKKLFNANNKFDYRAAYNDLEYIEKVNPNFKDVRNLIAIAHERGVDFVLVSMKNQTQQVLPKRLEEDVLNFNTYGLNELWTVYHGAKDVKITYDFGLELNLRKIEVSPEQVREKEFIKEKEVKDGFEYLLDKNGDQVLDEEGNKIKVDKLVSVRCELYQFTQFKSAEVTGQVKYMNLSSKQTIQTYPIVSAFAFQHAYANFKGDKRALESAYIDLIRLRVVSFPTNEQMIYDAGQGLKQKLKAIITRNSFRN
ncbi:hypothetical protein BTO04_04415 [Polaribacter sp. SA4-10]|uniref:hypothetical protein n=1 Tax=Polaribacter sp. SA4-10 TaxID=754397 RepID=UPI000B3CE4E3|nr:hypothetical protein [Polaribacter sp. SA4-10]ARV05990.1 hypothetical protein BTO04_04415 [Polaribacter sp. SA4-10]